MRRLLRVTALTLGTLLLIAYGYEVARDPERAELNPAARERAPGDFVTLSQGTTFYDVAGPDTGRVVVLVHGFSVPSYIWDSTFTALTAAGYRTIRYDVYGRGWSDRPDVRYDSATFTTQLAELLDSLKIRQPVDLVGLSYGGFVTGQFVTAHPERVRTLTLVDPVASSRSMPWFMTTPVLGPYLWQVMQVPGMADGQASDFLHPEHFPTWADQYRPQMRFKGFGRALLRSAITSSKTDFKALYARVGATQVPVLLVWGKQDQTVPIALADVVRAGVPNAEFFPVDSSGHLPHMEQAGPFNARLQQFLTAHAGRSGS